MNTLNYTTNAIEFMKDANLRMQASGVPATALMGLDWLMSVMVRAQKFSLPDGGRLFSLADNPTVDDLDRITSLFKLPYPAVIVEYAHPMNIGIDNRSEHVHGAPKRIGIAIETQSSYFNELMRFTPDLNDLQAKDGVVFGSVFSDEKDFWSFPIWMFFVPYEVEIKHKGELQFSDGHFEAMKLHNLGSDGAFLANLTGVVVNPYFHELMLQQGKTKSFVINDQLQNLRDEMMAILELCAVLNCSNVSSSVTPASPKLNKKRAEKNKTPFFDYHVLELAPMMPKAASTGAGSGSGDRNSPRAHLRRGHIRRLKREGGDIKMIWINAMVVGNVSHGLAAKDYSVQRQQ